MQLLVSFIADICISICFYSAVVTMLTENKGTEVAIVAGGKTVAKTGLFYPFSFKAYYLAFLSFFWDLKLKNQISLKRVIDNHFLIKTISQYILSQ